MRALALLFLACLAGCAGVRRPDILLLMPDQLRGDHLTAAGHPVLRTAHIDALAARGTLFRRAYTTVPSCIPARHSLLTGLFPQTSGVVGYRARRITAPILPGMLADAGYATVLVGRNMHQFPGDASPGYARVIHASTYLRDDDYDRALRAAVPDSGGIRGVVERLGLTNNGWRAAPWPLDPALHPTAWVARRAAEVLREVPAGQPVFLTASFYAPHPPLFPPRALFERFLAADLPAPAMGDWVDTAALTEKGDRAGHRVLLRGTPLRRAQAGYLGLIEHLDGELGPLIAAFVARSAAAGRPWVVVLTSDHGEMLGDHGYYRKCEPFEGSANIPLVIAGSDDLGFRPGGRSREPVCLEDVMPTLLDLAGVAPPPVCDGVSLVPVLRGETREVRAWLHTEHARCYSDAQSFHALTDGRFKYVWRSHDGREHLFDLEQDPREMRDLAADPDNPLLRQWRAVLVRRLADRPEGFSDGTRLIAGRRHLPLIPDRSR